MKQFLAEDEQADAYLDKPISSEDLKSLLRMIDMIWFY